MTISFTKRLGQMDACHNSGIQLVYIVNRKWTNRAEKRRDAFTHFIVSEKYDFSAVGPSLAPGRRCD